MDQPCNCAVHLKIEAEEPKKAWIPCVGHGAGCPCTEKLRKESKQKELPKGSEQA